MKAEQMFDELGYKKSTDIDAIAYSEKLDGTFHHFEITFDLLEKEIIIGTNMEYVIENDLLQAIIQQAKELGWTEDEKQETNYEYFKDEIIENCGFTFALVGGKLHKCACVNCNDCGFSTGHGCTEKIKEWLKKPHEKPVSVYKLTKFEKELLQCYPDIYSFKVFNSLNGMKEKGYFKGIDDNEIIGDILANCEVIE